jgi:hypothetical protein
VEKCGRARQDADDNMIWHIKDAIFHARSLRQEYGPTLLIFNTYYGAEL